MSIPIEYLQSRFILDEETGVLTWKKRPDDHFKTRAAARMWRSRFSGKSVGSKNADGYLHVTINSRMVKLHRIVIAMTTGCWPIGDVDHIDGNRTNNRPDNLRVVNARMNRRNSKVPSTNTSGRIGVYKETDQDAWYAVIGTGSGAKRLGTYGTIDEAIAARRGAEIALGYSVTHGRK